MYPSATNTPSGEPAPESTMSVEAAWGIVPGPQDRWSYLKNRDSILQRVKEVIDNHGSPFNDLQEKYPILDKREAYAHTRWKAFPPAEDEPLYLAAELPGESPPGKGAASAPCLPVLLGSVNVASARGGTHHEARG